MYYLTSLWNEIFKKYSKYISEVFGQENLNVWSTDWNRSSLRLQKSIQNKRLQPVPAFVWLLKSHNVKKCSPKRWVYINMSVLSANTVPQRIKAIAENISLYNSTLWQNKHLERFSLTLDESTNMSDTAQILNFIREVYESYELYEELLNIDNTGEDIFKRVGTVTNKI